jgi:23S rRNA (cytosine1962-C5)-methyltransferase
MLNPVCPIRLLKGKEDQIRKGFPWIYAGDMVDSSEPLLAPEGSLVSIETHKGEFVGIGYFNAKSQIAARVLTLKKEPIDESFFAARLAKALERREKLISVPYYRLIHSESDFLPGLLIDRFGEKLVIQVATAGMELLQPLWLSAVESLLQPNVIVLRNDVAARKLEGLTQEVSVIKGNVSELVEVQENGCVYLADLLKGQKTGWFFDQRDNRKMIAGLAKDKTLLDVYSHSGGFGVLAAKAGAGEATLVDSSKLALELAGKAAVKNHVQCSYLQGDAFEVMQALAREGKHYDIALADPPAFVKNRKDIASGMKGYEKVAKLAATLVEKEGLLFVASCSHHASRGAFNNAVMAGIKKAGRAGEIIRQTGAAPDHPRHPQLRQSEYLKGLLVKLA